MDNWTWYLVDNGSTDKTGKMIYEYAQRDNRIVPLANKKNQVWEPGNGITEIIAGYDDSDRICWIDADDAYKPDFLEKMSACMDANRLDIAACGNDFVDAKTKKCFSVRKLNQDLFLEDQRFQTCFPEYHQFMRTYWAKLFSVSLLRRYDSTRVPSVSYGWDTLFTTEMFRNATRIGILAESLYKYYISPKSASYHWDANRIEADRVLHKSAHDFLLAKCGYIAPYNEDFLLLVYMNAIKDTLKVLWNSDISDNEKLTGILDTFSHKYTKQLAAKEHFDTLFGDVAELARQRSKLFAGAAEWLLSREEVPDEQVEQFCNVGEFVCAASENAKGWVFFKKLRAQFWIENGQTDEAKAELDELAELLPADEEIVSLRSQMLLAGTPENPV